MIIRLSLTTQRALSGRGVSGEGAGFRACKTIVPNAGSKSNFDRVDHSGSSKPLLTTASLTTFRSTRGVKYRWPLLSQALSLAPLTMHASR